MFYEGDLQSGIAHAIQHGKMVASFVRDDSDESLQWENDFLRDDAVSSALQAKAVLLRIQAQSQEAGYLSAICPISGAPTVVILKNGQILAHLSGSMSQSDFTTQVLAALDENASGVSSEAMQPSHPAQQDHSASLNPDTASADSSQAQTPRTPSPSSADSAAQPQQPSHPTVLSTPPPHLRNTPETISSLPGNTIRKDKGKGRAPSPTPASDPKKASEISYAAQQRRRQQDARKERERILRLVEQDKIDRREREERRRALAKAEADPTSPGSDPVAPVISSGSSISDKTNAASSSTCALSVRLLSGATIRERFPSATTTLRSDVREWIDEHRSDDGDIPYTFKQILSPLPNKTISISEEEQSLQSLGLAPSATLVLVSVEGYSNAYAGNEPGILFRAASSVYRMVASGVRTVAGALGTFLGIGAATPVASSPADPASSLAAGSSTGSSHSSSHSSINVRTLRDQDETRRDDRQFYNGNQLNFEPRDDDEDRDAGAGKRG
ncbi:MAG: hypothetical protein M1817_001405 [Caeruleum heppii]|nr:MAG: hypothetical protein M1817_001405 [Caeruleum heppii]